VVPPLQRQADHRDGLITNDKFCFSRTGKLKLNWWRRPLRLRHRSVEIHSTLLKDEKLSGGTNDTRVDDTQTNSATERRGPAVGPGLSKPSEMEQGENPIVKITGGAR
jgi:hypothetical protein